MFKNFRRNGLCLLIFFTAMKSFVGSAHDYATLGLSSGATKEEARKAYRRLMLQYHPDKQAGKSDKERKEAEERTKEINASMDAIAKGERQTEDQAESWFSKSGGAKKEEQTKRKSREEGEMKTEEEAREQQRRELEKRIEARIRGTARAGQRVGGQKESRETQKKMEGINEWLESKKRMEEERVRFCKNISERIKEISADVDVSNFDTKIGAAIGVLDNAIRNNKEISHQSIEDAKMAFLRSKKSQLEALKVEFAKSWSFSLTGVPGKQVVVDKFKQVSLSRN